MGALSNPGAARNMVYNEVNVYNGAGVVAWTPLYLGAVVGPKLTLVTLKAMSPTNTIAFRTPGDTDQAYITCSAVMRGITLAALGNNLWTQFILWTDAAGALEVYMEDTDNYTIDVIGYIN
ncbi:hypothetical protein LCGC14_1615880 [marine sediment metagenome]|uniref:Uncharacterized protein n=1 Tax=marine sediment metagenome TaxID=412755 RepID=A0A0F9KME3_9ZZZZ